MSLLIEWLSDNRTTLRLDRTSTISAAKRLRSKVLPRFGAMPRML